MSGRQNETDRKNESKEKWLKKITLLKEKTSHERNVGKKIILLKEKTFVATSPVLQMHVDIDFIVL